MGRPKDRSNIPLLLEDLANGVGSLRQLCTKYDFKIGTFLMWVGDEPELAEQYARARESGLEVMAEDLLAIADDGTNDTYVDDQGNRRTDHDVVARSRLRVDTRKWLLSKMLPKKYGDKLDVTTQGDKIEGNSIHITREVIGGK